MKQLVKPYIIDEELGATYKAMAKDMKAKEKANEWVEAVIDN